MGNITGGSPQDLVRIKSIQVAVELFPLLRKQIKIKTIAMDHPEIFLEKLEDGQVNWVFTPVEKATQASSQSTGSSSRFEVAVEKILIHDGRVVYHEKGKDIEVEEINTTSKLDSLNGPYAANGTFKAYGQTLKFDTKLGNLGGPQGEPQSVTLAAQFGDSAVNVDGKIFLSSQTFKGTVKATGDPKIFRKETTKDKPSPLVSGPLRVESAVEADTQEIRLSGAKFEIGSAHPTGDLKFVFKDGLQIQGKLDNLPGQGQATFTLIPSPKGISGSVSATVSQGKELLRWLEIETKTMPPEVLGPLSVSTNYNLGETTQFQNIDLTISDAKLLGNVSWQSQKGSPFVVVDLVSPKIENIFKLLGVKDPKHLGVGKLKGNLQWTPTSLHLAHLKGQLGPNLAFSGDIAVDHEKPKPTVKAVLSLNSVNVSTLLASRQMENPLPSEGKIFLVSAKQSSSNPKWSQAPLDFSFLSKFDGQFDISASQLNQGEIVISHPKLIATVQNGRLDITSLTGSIFEGAFTGKGHLTAANTLQFHMTLRDANMKHLSSHGSTIKIVAGKLFLTSDLTTHGNSLHAMIQNLDGPLSITAKDGIINGFDLHTLSQRLGSLQNPQSLFGLFNTTMGQGQTPFSSFKGDILFKGGVGTIQSMSFVAKEGQGNATGQIDLPRYLLNIYADFRLTEHTNLPPFHMQLSGPIDNPSRKLDTGTLQKYMLENVFKGVIENLGKGKMNAGDVLGSLLGGGKRNGNSEPQQAPQQQEPKSNKPEQIVKDLIKGIF